MKILLTTLLLSTCFFSFTQTDKELWSNLKEGSSSERVRACDLLARRYQSEATDSLKIIGDLTFSYGIEEHYFPAIEQGKLTLALWFITNGQTADGITLAKSLIPNMKGRGDDRMLSGTAGTIALGYIQQKDGKSANYWAKQAQNFAKDNPDPLIRIESYQALAESYLLLNDADTAITLYKQYIKVIEPFDKYRSLSSAYAKLGDIERSKGNLAVTKKHFQTSLRFAELSGASIPMAHALNNMAILYFEEGNKEKTLEYFMKALEIREKIRDPKSISESYYNIGEFYYAFDDYQKATEWYQKSGEYAKSMNLLTEQADAIMALSVVMKETGDFKGAVDLLEEYITLQEQIAIRNDADNEEISILQREIERQEAEAKAKKGDFSMDEANKFKWEWIVISILTILFLMTLFFRSMRVNSDAREKQDQKQVFQP